MTSKGKYSTPALSPDGKMIAAIEFTPERNSTLVILDSENGKVIDRWGAFSFYDILTNLNLVPPLWELSQHLDWKP